jgi:SAM-dependent methyltransferase
MTTSESYDRAFTFGKNWRRFLQNYTPQRQASCQQALLSFLQRDELRGKNFLDIGCGSGINSAAALLAGAQKIFSFDYDQDSVAATQQLHLHHGAPNHWQVGHGSVLDTAYMRNLGTFDIVYAWGMLHHTGNQWQALRNAVAAMHDQSVLYIALYAKETQYPHWQYWLDVKQRYNRASKIEKCWMEMQYIWQTICGKQFRKLFELPRIIQQYQHARGMDFMTDVRDWLGGWPTEFSSVPEVTEFAAHEFGLTLINLRTGEACSEFLFARKDQVAALGYQPVDLQDHQFGVPILEDCQRLPAGPVWIFGTARGGDLMLRYLRDHKVTIAGFIDVTSSQTALHGLPVLQVDNFMATQPQTSTIILANRYVRENSARLRAKGFTVLLNGHPLVISLHHNR